MDYYNELLNEVCTVNISQMKDTKLCSNFIILYCVVLKINTFCSFFISKMEDSSLVKVKTKVMYNILITSGHALSIDIQPKQIYLLNMLIVGYCEELLMLVCRFLCK